MVQVATVTTSTDPPREEWESFRHLFRKEGSLNESSRAPRLVLKLFSKRRRISMYPLIELIVSTKKFPIHVDIGTCI
jgi:hypothetical protein